MTSSPPSASEGTLRMIAAIWRRNQPEVLERLALLDEAAAAVSTRTLTAALAEQAAAVAHKLAGSLGMFGFPEGTRIARELELMYESPVPDGEMVAGLTRQLRDELFPGTIAADLE